jgi:hypothetical protein
MLITEIDPGKIQLGIERGNISHGSPFFANGPELLWVDEYCSSMRVSFELRYGNAGPVASDVYARSNLGSNQR